MTLNIQPPAKGEPLRASWAADVSRALNAFPDKIGAPFRNERNRRFEKPPLPFEVRWDSSLSSGSGSWKIYLPDVESLCLVKEDYEEITGVTPIQDADGNDTPWHTIDDITSSGSEDVWLVVTVPDSGTTGTASAELLSDEGQASTGEKVYNVHIAALEVVAATSSTPAEHNVRQYVDSAVIISGAADEVTPDDVSTEFIPDPPSGTQPDGDEGKLQIKGWKTGTPAETNSIGDILSGNGGTDEEDEQMICRQADGTLVFRTIGEVKGGGGLSGTVSFVADVKYDLSYHQLQQRIDTLDLATGQVTQGQYAMITNGQAVPLSGS